MIVDDRDDADTNACVACGEVDLQTVYVPRNSPRGLTVKMCRACAFVQSWPRIDHAPGQQKSLTADGGWGNIRYGKGFRTRDHLSLLGHRMADQKPTRLLDVGSSRGSFILGARELWPDCDIVAVEPDQSVTSAYDMRRDIRFIGQRIEQVGFDRESFDLIYSCHTLEHLADPVRVLEDHRAWLRPGGLLLLEVPNFAHLHAEDIVEEWFIDKHLNHYTEESLLRQLDKAGFEVVMMPRKSDRANLTILARPREGHQNPPMAWAPAQEISDTEQTIYAYTDRIRANRALLASVSDRIVRMPANRIAIWGAGRIFHALVQYGGLPVEHLGLIIDSQLSTLGLACYGRAIDAPSSLATGGIDTVIVASRLFAKEIEAEALRQNRHLQIIFFQDLMDDARENSRLAATA
ncbi:MAG: class I SAM-dependent methyltransferase [Pseudomonadota bacterium]